MPDPTDLAVVYSARSLGNATEIKAYLLHHFTQKEVDKFYLLLQSFEKIIVVFSGLVSQKHQEYKNPSRSS